MQEQIQYITIFLQFSTWNYIERTKKQKIFWLNTKINNQNFYKELIDITNRQENKKNRGEIDYDTKRLVSESDEALAKGIVNNNIDILF